MESVLAKFVCNEIETQEGGSKVLRLSACVDESGDGRDFTPYTPWGEIEMGLTDKTKADEFFQVGRLY